MTEEEIIYEIYRIFHNKNLNRLADDLRSGSRWGGACTELNELSKSTGYDIEMRKDEHIVEFVFKKENEEFFYINLTPHNIQNQQTIEARNDTINEILNYKDGK